MLRQVRINGFAVTLNDAKAEFAASWDFNPPDASAVRHTLWRRPTSRARASSASAPQPYVEAWNRRATIYYMKKDFGRAIDDIHELLKREQRHFGALSGLGIILQEVGDEKDALAAFRRALAIHPHLERIPDLVKKLTDKIDGRDI
jgi:Flp pilus assembly protein TadD